MATSAAARSAGFTLVECMTVCAVAAVLAALALPGYRSQSLRSGRIDAVAALTQLQAAQERHRSQHGRYAQDLATLGLGAGGQAASPQGLYALTLELQGPDAYLATAQARGSQAEDAHCSALTLAVASGFASEGPTPGCWQR